MAKKPQEIRHQTDLNMPAIITQALNAGQQILLPSLTELEANQIPTLFDFMRPMVLPDPRYRGEGKPPKALREPLLLVSWDRRAGAWKASLSDKILASGGSCLVKSLLTTMVDVETELVAGKFNWAAKKIS